MRLEHSFTVPVGVDEAWSTLTDIERVVPCMPGATLESVDGDELTGSVKVKVGPIAMTYRGRAQWVERDEVAHRASMRAQGKDPRGNSTAAATVNMSLHAAEDGSSGTLVRVVTDLDITGRPAQFGRGVMADVGNKLIGQFADCLAGQWEVEPESEAELETPPMIERVGASPVEPQPVVEPAEIPPAETPPVDTTAPAPAGAPPREAEPIDLLSAAGPAVARRVVPILLAVVAVVLVVLAFVSWL